MTIRAVFRVDNDPSCGQLYGAALMKFPTIVFDSKRHQSDIHLNVVRHLITAYVECWTRRGGQWVEFRKVFKTASCKHNILDNKYTVA